MAASWRPPTRRRSGPSTRGRRAPPVSTGSALGAVDDRRRGDVVTGGLAGQVAARPSGGDGDQDEPGRRRRRPSRPPAAASESSGSPSVGGVGAVGCADGPGNGRGGAVGGAVPWAVGPRAGVGRRAWSVGGDVGGASGCRGRAPGSRGSNMAPGWVAAARRGAEQGENRVRLGRSMQEAAAPGTGPAAAVGSPA